MRPIYQAGVAALAMLGLVSCEDSPKLWSRSEIETIAEDFSDANASVIDHNAATGNELSEKVTDLEDEVQRLRRRIELQDAEIRELYDNQEKMADWANRQHGL